MPSRRAASLRTPPERRSGLEQQVLLEAGQGGAQVQLPGRLAVAGAAGAPPASGARSSASRPPRGLRISARSITLRSSRTLPGQE